MIVKYVVVNGDVTQNNIGNKRVTNFFDEFFCELAQMPWNKVVNESIIVEGVGVEKPKTDVSCCSSSRLLQFLDSRH